MNTTLLIDGNWLLMSRLFAVKSLFNVQNDEKTKLEGTAELEDLLCKSINLIINKFDGVVNNIVLVADGGSWRKNIEKPKFFDEVYKGNRIKDSEVDWNYIYKALDDIVEKANEVGITTSKMGGVEGDDWIRHWSRKLNKQGINCIIWSSDCDLKQLIQYDKGRGSFTCWYNEQQKSGLPGLFLPKELDDTSVKEIDEIDFFMTPDLSNTDLDAIRATARAVTYIDPADIVEEKIVCGDRGDNIKSIILIKKGTKTYRVSENDWHKIKDKLNITSLDQFFESRDKICEAIINSSKYSKYTINEQNAREMFDYNIKLVWLHEKTFPADIQEEMNKIEYKRFDLSYIKSNYKVLRKLEVQQKSIEEIFDGAVDDCPF